MQPMHLTLPKIVTGRLGGTDIECLLSESVHAAGRLWLFHSRIDVIVGDAASFLRCGLARISHELSSRSVADTGRTRRAPGGRSKRT